MSTSQISAIILDRQSVFGFSLPFIFRLAAYAFTQLRKLPYVQNKIAEKLEPAKEDILQSIHKDDTDRVFITGEKLTLIELFRNSLRFYSLSQLHSLKELFDD